MTFTRVLGTKDSLRDRKSHRLSIRNSQTVHLEPCTLGWKILFWEHAKRASEHEEWKPAHLTIINKDRNNVPWTSNQCIVSIEMSEYIYKEQSNIKLIWANFTENTTSNIFGRLSTAVENAGNLAFISSKIFTIHSLHEIQWVASLTSSKGQPNFTPQPMFL